jgi:hypothetical protein
MHNRARETDRDLHANDFILIDSHADLVDVSRANEQGTHCQLPLGGSIDATPSLKARAAVLYAARPFRDGVALI